MITKSTMAAVLAALAISGFFRWSTGKNLGA